MPPTLMPHAERQALINQPFPTTTVHPKHTWGGVQIVIPDHFEENGRKRPGAIHDDSYIRYGRADDDAQGD